MRKKTEKRAVKSPEPFKEADLRDLLMLCRSYGVLHFKRGGLEFTLASALATDPATVPASTPQVAASQPETGVKGEQKLGADGLTAEQQEELFGRPMDAKG